jgi:hypothetical protein
MNEPPHFTQSWTIRQLHELVMDLRVDTGSPEKLHRKFYDRLIPWWDAHNESLRQFGNEVEKYQALAAERWNQLQVKKKDGGCKAVLWIMWAVTVALTIILFWDMATGFLHGTNF